MPDLLRTALRAAALLALALGAPLRAQTPPDAPALYQQHCAACHGAQRTGLMGPALLPESLERTRPAEVLRVIREGRQATQMAGYAGQLSGAEIQALADWIRTPAVPAPRWSEADIRASRIATPLPDDEPVRPKWSADPMNLFVVVEGGDHHVSLLDGDRFTVITRFASRYALHGGPKFTPDGRYVFFGSRDGWITKYDLWRLQVVAEVRAGLNMRNVAVSGDGRWVMAANYLPHSLALFDADLNLVKTYEAATLDGKASSRVSAVYDATPRNSFVVALKDIPEIWEISYDKKAAPIYDGLVHDYKMGEAIAKPGYLGVRRTPLSEPLDDFFFDQSYRHVLGATRPQAGKSETASAQVVNLDVRRKIADLPIAGMPHLGSGITFAWNGTTVLASPNLGGTGVDVIDMQSWKNLRTIPTPGAGFFMRSHENTPYAWTDSMMSKDAKDRLTIIDKRTLEPVAEVREPGKTLAHIEFTRDGRYALASVWEMDGALIVYDAATFREVKRLPMAKPVGKYNVWNKITRSEGTSH
ncbi:cytochrome c [Alicycliphilus denitrificans]|uniref:nitrite reductase n=1 Tax=Alicycliphilus denitrificans TaxID=179636 RepID=UPI00095CDE12|nr:nitrite reductase [Alicycliphilus denitrificans]MBN9573717.1 c-type cytochrome [Alicycliphilus denitrificans]OJW90414.1 MAG: cytochrome C oxidase Cbb3 [Alicycliphilus sp. 69-12]BCN38792.1 cytochrome c [Alicycliphilus denitrificans]